MAAGRFFSKDRGAFAFVSALFAALIALAVGTTAPPAQAVADTGELQASPISAQTTVNKFYAPGKTATGSADYYDSHIYTFVLTGAADVKYRFSSNSYSGIRWSLYSTSSGSSVSQYGYAYTGYSSTGSMYLPAGTYKVSVSGYGYYSKSPYSFNISKVAQTLKLSSTSGKIASFTAIQDVPFTFSGTNDYVSKNLTVKVKNTKVASAYYSLGSGGAGTLKITPLALGKTTISLKLVGAKTAKYTVYVTKANVYVAKGKSTKLAKPIGATKAKLKMKKNKKATLKAKTGKLKAKKQGRVTVTAKKKGVKYTYNVVIVDYVKLARDAYKYLEEYVPNPDKMKIHNAYKGYNKTIMAAQKNLPVAYLDYSYMNENGGYERKKIIAYYDDALDMKYVTAQTSNDIMKKKSFSKKELKKVTK